MTMRMPSDRTGQLPTERPTETRTVTYRAPWQPKHELAMRLKRANTAGDGFGGLLPQHLIDKGFRSTTNG